MGFGGGWTPAAVKIAWTMHTAEDLRVPARSGKDARRNARLSMAAPVPEGVGRTEAGRMTGVDRRAVRDRVHRCNAESPEGFRARCGVGCAGLGRGGVGPGTRRGCSVACSQFRSAFSVRVKARVREVLGSSALSQPVEVWFQDEAPGRSEGHDVASVDASRVAPACGARLSLRLPLPFRGGARVARQGGGTGVGAGEHGGDARDIPAPPCDPGEGRGETRAAAERRFAPR